MTREPWARGVLALAALALLAMLVTTGVLRGLDRALLELAQRADHPALDVLGSAVGLLGQAEVTAGIALGLTVARLVTGRREAAVPLFIGLVVIVELALKLSVPQPPPPEELSRSVVLLPGAHAALPGAFPSGHMARAAFLAAIVHVPRSAAVAALVLLTLSRVHLAEHWPSDVLGGLLLGYGVAAIARSRVPSVWSGRT